MARNGEVGRGVYEVRIHTQREYLVLYVAKFAEAVYVFHAFEKRTRQISRRDEMIRLIAAINVERSNRFRASAGGKPKSAPRKAL